MQPCNAWSEPTGTVDRQIFTSRRHRYRGSRRHTSTREQRFSAHVSTSVATTFPSSKHASQAPSRLVVGAEGPKIFSSFGASLFFFSFRTLPPHSALRLHSPVTNHKKKTNPLSHGHPFNCSSPSQQQRRTRCFVVKPDGVLYLVRRSARPATTASTASAADEAVEHARPELDIAITSDATVSVRLRFA